MKKWIFNGQEIAYQCSGNGPCLLLLHGFMESQQIWDTLRENLSRYGKIITVDLPGHGDSQGVAEIHSPQLMATIVDEILQAENVDTAFVVGHSMGGYVAAEFANLFPKHCNGIAFFHSHAAQENEAGIIQRNRVINMLYNNKKEFITAFIPDLFSAENREKLRPEINELVRIAQKMNTEDIIAAQKGMRDRNDHLDLLAKTTLPVWFIHGKYDSKCHPEMIWSQALSCQNARVFILPTGHMGYLEAPLLVTQIFQEYLLANQKPTSTLTSS